MNRKTDIQAYVTDHEQEIDFVTYLAEGKKEALRRIQLAKENNSTELDLSGVGLEEIPSELLELTQLRVLNLGSKEKTGEETDVEYEPDDYGCDYELDADYYEPGYNSIVTLPSLFFASLQNLVSLNLRGNSLKLLSAEIGNLSKLEKLDLSNNPLTKLPAQIGKLKVLKELDLSSNRLTSLPVEICQLVALEKLKLSKNNLTKLPGDIARLIRLKQLYLDENKRLTLPGEIAQLKTIKELDLSENDLITLPLQIIQLTGLEKLRLRQNKLTTLSQEIGDLTALTELDVSYNRLTSLPAEMAQLIKLEKLTLYANQLTWLPQEIGCLTALTELDIAENALILLPNEINQLNKLKKINCHRNKLRSLPAGIGCLKVLSELNLANNNLTELPVNIGDLTELIKLNLAVNELTVLPSTIGKLTKLIECDLIGNKLNALPVEIGKLTALIAIDLSGNILTSLPDEFGQLTALKNLNLKYNKLTSIPVEIKKLTALIKFDLSENRLASLPIEIGGLRALEKLDLSYNRLASLPIEIGGLRALEKLDLSHNRLASLPDEIGKLVALRKLNLRYNELNSLPPNIGYLNALDEIDLGGNKLISLPQEIGRLNKLKELDLNHNELASLPIEIGQLGALKELDLSYNGLTSLPAKIGHLKELRHLNIGSNKLRALPIEICQLVALKVLNLEFNPLPELLQKAWNEAGISGLRHLLQALLGKHVSIFEAKLIIVGIGKVGKSWALAALRGENPEETVGEQTTYGVYCGELLVPHPEAGKNKNVPEGTKIQFNAWDFGGQKVYRIIQQFFFTEDAIYVLVWNPRDGVEKCQIREWLQMIEMRTDGKAKVIIVASHSPLHKTPYLPNYGKDRLPYNLAAMILDEIAIDSKLGDNVNELRQMLAKHAATLPYMGESFPESWKKSRDAIATLNSSTNKKRVPYIDYERFQNICRSHGIVEEAHMLTLVTVYMHNLGRVIYYGNRHHTGGYDPLLTNFIVLDAEWLSRAFLQILEDKTTNDNGGMLKHKWLERIWRLHGRDDWLKFSLQEHPFLIRLMHAFEMSYVVKGCDGQRSLVPQLLPAIEPSLPWRYPSEHKNSQPVRLICKIENEIYGLMPRFIVNTADYQTDSSTFWSNGVFLSEKTYGNEALVTLDGIEKPVMTVSVSGPQPPWFLGELYRILQKQLNDWPGLRKTFFIGCPTRTTNGSLCQGEFEFNFLIDEDLEKPEDLHACRVCRKRFTPNQLLSGYRPIILEQKQETQRALEWSLAKEQAPCPRAFTLVPADKSWYDARNFVPEKVGGRKLKITLLSEHSLLAVTSKEFYVPPKWIKWLIPLVRIGSLALGSAALTFTGDVEKELKAAADFMKDFSGDIKEYEKDAMQDDTTSLTISWPSGPELDDLYYLLKEIKLAPHFGGMQLRKIKHKGYLWISKSEAKNFAEEIPNLTYIPKH
jgi:Leucine-rich repeat (LRR) protein/GTPase SAR1 family protein